VVLQEVGIERALLEGAVSHDAEVERDVILQSLDVEALERIVGAADGLLARGAPGLHFYTLNQAALTTTIWQRLGL